MTSRGGRKGIVYLAGPDYAPEESRALETLAEFLGKDGWEVYIPGQEGLERDFMRKTEKRLGNNLLFFREVIERAAFALEVYQIVERCDALVFNMNGRVPDEGGVFKAAVAFAAGKPLLLYKRDHRSKLHGNDNAMITGLSFDFRHVRKAKKLPRALDGAIARSATYGPTRYTSSGMPPLVLQMVEQGREVWNLLPRRGEPDFFENLASVMTTTKL